MFNRPIAYVVMRAITATVDRDMLSADAGEVLLDRGIRTFGIADHYRKASIDCFRDPFFNAAIEATDRNRSGNEDCFHLYYHVQVATNIFPIFS